MEEKKTNIPPIKKKTGLGRGLDALLGNDNMLDSEGKFEMKSTPTLGHPDLQYIPLEQIVEANPFQPRTNFDADELNELTESIKEHGVNTPVTLRRLSANTYQIIAGERRVRASRQAGIVKIPALIKQEVTDQKLLELSLIENIQRSDLNPIEVAFSLQRLITECKISQEEVGGRINVKRSTVTNYLRLLKLPSEIQSAIIQQTISMGHAKAMVNIEKLETQMVVFRKVIAESLSVRQTEELVRRVNQQDIESKKPVTPPTVDKKNDPEIANLRGKLISKFGTNVALKVTDNNKGEIAIPFSSTDDLNRILEILDLV